MPFTRSLPRAAADVVAPTAVPELVVATAASHAVAAAPGADQILATATAQVVATAAAHDHVVPLRPDGTSLLGDDRRPGRFLLGSQLVPVGDDLRGRGCHRAGERLGQGALAAAEARAVPLRLAVHLPAEHAGDLDRPRRREQERGSAREHGCEPCACPPSLHTRPR